MIPSDIITKADRQKVRNGPVVSVENIKSNNNNKKHTKKNRVKGHQCIAQTKQHSIMSFIDSILTNVIPCGLAIL